MPVKGGAAAVMEAMAYHLVPDATVTAATWTSGTQVNITLLSGDVNEATLLKWFEVNLILQAISTEGVMVPMLLAIYKATSTRDINDEDIVQDLKVNKALFLHELIAVPTGNAGAFKLRKMLRRVILSPGPENLYLSFLPKRTTAANAGYRYLASKYASQLTG